MSDQPEVVNYITHFIDRFVIVPVDKASNDVGIVCKAFYLDDIKNQGFQKMVIDSAIKYMDIFFADR